MITFYLPNWRSFTTTKKDDSPGGVQVLILNICEALNKLQIKPKIISFKTGYVYVTARKKNLNFLFVDSDNPNFIDHVDEDDILVVFSGYFFRDLSVFKKKNIKFFYWSVFPDHLVTKFSFYKKLSKFLFFKIDLLSGILIKYFVKKLESDNALYFMDESHYSVIKLYGIKIEHIEKNLLPIPIKISERNENIRKEVINKKNINIGYIGRAEIWKIFPFLKLFQDFNTANFEEFNIRFYVITNNKDLFHEIFNSHSQKFNENVEINYITGLENKTLERYLIKNIDILFAMGTSLLEGAKLGIPTVIVDPSPVMLPDDYNYRWLYEESGYTLGYPISLLKLKKGHKIKRIISMVYNKNNGYFVEGLKCYNYVKKNHDINKIIVKFINAVYNTQGKFCNYNNIYKLVLFGKWIARLSNIRKMSLLKH